MVRIADEWVYEWYDHEVVEDAYEEERSEDFELRWRKELLVALVSVEDKLEQIINHFNIKG